MNRRHTPGFASAHRLERCRGRSWMVRTLATVRTKAVRDGARDRKFRNDSWGVAPAMEMTVGYLVVVPADRQLTQLFIPRRTRVA